MDDRQKQALLLLETDITGAVKRLNGDEELYTACLKIFADDQTVNQLEISLNEGNWDDAFTAAHALKGLAGNMGFVPLMLSVSSLLVSIRSGKTKEAGEYLKHVKRQHKEIKATICKYF